MNNNTDICTNFNMYIDIYVYIEISLNIGTVRIRYMDIYI